ncbi:MAG TPA: hypothetical protein VMM59_03690 [Thermohalobaculum sp.]|nr:hypothetical protein [Thermohalobaculum sp.]
MRALLPLLAACMALSGCLGLGKSEAKSEPKAEVQTAEASAVDQATDGTAASMTSTGTASVTMPPVKPAPVKAASVKTAAAGSASGTPPSVRTAGVKNPMDDRNCYTVDLFTDVEVEAPPEGLPERYTQYLGQWGNGAWNDVWCHDLLVHRVYPDGQVALVDMHAPYKPWNQPATAFRRVGWIDDAGKLHFNYGPEKATYEIVGDTMKGSRNVRGVGTLHIELTRRAKQPKQAARPLRVAEAPPPGS